MAGYYDLDQMQAYIRKAAAARGIDPDIAIRVAKSEGLAPGAWQSNFKRPDGSRERSYGPYQLFVDGGLGNQFQKATGLDPSDPSTVYQGVDFALDHASKNGWGAWYGAGKVGIGNRQGIGGKASGAAPTAPVMGSMAPNSPGPQSTPPGPSTAPPPAAPAEDKSKLSDIMAMIGSLGPQQAPTPQLAPIQGPSPDQANALANLIAQLRSKRIA